MYPFYVKSEASGRKTPITGGCQQKDGTQTTHIYQRDRGESKEVFTIEQFSFINKEGKRILCTCVHNEFGYPAVTAETEY